MGGLRGKSTGHVGAMGKNSYSTGKKSYNSGFSQQEAMLAQAAAFHEADDRVQCKFCGRKFNAEAAERHIPHCEKKSKDIRARSKITGGRR